jgi:type IV pilus assembly protein PilV
MTNRTFRQNSTDAKNGSQGFTLIEVLIAIVILSVGLLGMASLTVGIMNGNKISNELTTATTLAEDKMEDLRRLKEIGYLNVVAETKADCSSPYGEYRREVLVTDDSPAPNMKTVTVTAYWGGTSKEDHKVELQTIFGR